MLQRHNLISPKGIQGRLHTNHHVAPWRRHALSRRFLTTAASGQAVSSSGDAVQPSVSEDVPSPSASAPDGQLRPVAAGTQAGLEPIDVEATAMPAVGNDAEAAQDSNPEAMLTAASAAPTLSSHPIQEDGSGGEDLFGSKELIEELQDSQSFGRRGEALLFAQVAALALLLFPPFALKGLVDLFATLLLTAGAVFIGYALFSLGRNFSPLPQPRNRHNLVVTGMYSYVRHPMYAGLLMGALGLAALTRNETRLALAGLLWWILEQKVTAEERALTERYPDYADYATKVKKFIPFLY